MKTVNLQVRINEDLKQEVSSILKAQGLSYTSMLDALFRQIIKERRIPFDIALPTTPTEKTPTPSTLKNDGTYEQPQTTLKVSDTTRLYGTRTTNEVEIFFDKIDKTGILNIRINPKVKTLTTAILKEMGLTISQTVTLVSKQIQFAKDIPPTIHRPEWIDAINDDLWTKEDLSTGFISSEVKMRYTIILTPTAKSDIVSLKISLVQQLIDQAVIRKELELIYEKISSLTVFPERYPIVNSKTKFRKLSHRKYLILYKVINNYIYVFYIRPSKMNTLQEIQNI